MALATLSLAAAADDQSWSRRARAAAALTRYVDEKLSAATTSHQEMIDHHLASGTLANMEVPNSVEVYRVDQFVPNFRRTTSDHSPVISHFTLVH